MITNSIRRVAMLWICLLAATGCAAESSRFQDTVESLRNAVLRGEIKEAMASYEAEAQRAEKNAEWGTAINAYTQAAEAARLAGQLQKAITFSEKAVEIAHRTNAAVLPLARGTTPGWGNLEPPPLPEIKAIRSLIASYRAVRDFDKVMALAERGLTLLKENPAGDWNTRLLVKAGLYSTLGDDLVRRGEYEKAIEALSHAVNLGRAHFSARSAPRVPQQLAENSQTQLIARLLDLGRAYRLAGRFDDALEQYNEATTHLKSGGTRAIQEFQLYSNLGEVYAAQKQFPLALENLNKALALAEKQGRSAGISSASARLAGMLRQTGKVADALPYYQKAIEQTESIRSRLQSEQYRQSFFEGGLDAYVSMMGVLLELGRPEDAFNYSERARSRTFLDVLGSKIQLARSGTLLEQERALQARISVLQAMAEGQDGDSVETAELRKQLAEAQQAYNEYLAKVRTENKEQASLMSVEPLTLQQVQERLDPGVTLLEYFVANNNVWLWVVEKDRFQFVSTSMSKKELVSKVTQLRDTIYQFGEKEKFNGLSQELYKLLVQPALSSIHGKELIIVPHDVLHYLPFQALQSSDGRYLIEKYPIYYLSSASLLQFTQEKRRAKGGNVLAFGNPDLGDSEKNLEYAELEAKEVKAAYPEGRVFLGKEATEAKSKTLSPSQDIIHFATHAELKEDDPLSSAILLAKDDKEDGRLEVREIFGMTLKADLVVLSGCDTALGKLSTGDELVGLTRAFIYAGTPSVIASLWSVDDSSTAQLMASFYKNLKTMTKSEALRQAQLQLIRGTGQSDLLAKRGVGGIGKLGETPASQSSSENTVSLSTSHPYFWAPFILVGDGK